MILAPCIIPKFFDNNGQPLAKGLLFSYVAGTTTKQTTYTDSTGGTPNTNPIVLDFRGECQLWLDTTKTYKFVLAPATDTDPPTNPIKTVDNVVGGYGGTIDWTQIIYDQTAAEIAAGVTPVNLYINPGNGDPTRYGFTGNGVADDSTALNAALSAYGYVKIVGTGLTIGIGSQVKMPSNSFMDLNLCTVKRLTGSGVYDMIANSDQVGGNVNVRVIRGIVDGNAAADSLVSSVPADRFCGISFVNVTGISSIESCAVTNTVNAENTIGGILVYGCDDVVVKFCQTYTNDRTGIVYRNGNRCKFLSNICHDNVGSGITGANCDSAEFIGNHCYSNGSGGNYSGLNCSGIKNTARGNYCYSNTGSGINCGESGDPADNSILSDNFCYSNTLEGITVGYSVHVTVSKNVCYDNVRNNIRAFHASDDCTVTGNMCYGTGYASGTSTGIYMDDGVRAIVTDNHVWSMASSGIYIDPTATDSTVANNTCRDNCVVNSANAGIVLDTVTGCSVSNNRCFDTLGASGTQTSGIRLIAGSGNAVINNNISGNKTNPILETSSPSYTRIGNRIGTDPLQGSFTVTATATYTVNNNSVQSTGRIVFQALNTAATGKPIYPNGVSAGTSFTVAPASGSFAGTETYAFRIE